MSIVNPNNQKEMSEEAFPRKSIRVVLEDREVCDSCLNKKSILLMFSIKNLHICEDCMDAVMASVCECVDSSMKKSMQAYGLEGRGFRKATDGYQPEPDIHDIEMVGSELWIKDKEGK